MNYVDPSGHFSEEELEKFLRHQYGKNWKSYWDAWRQDKIFWSMLLEAKEGDELRAPTSDLGSGWFNMCDGLICFSSDSNVGLEAYQGVGPYTLIGKDGVSRNGGGMDYSGLTITQAGSKGSPSWTQPVFDYSTGVPVDTGFVRIVTYANPKSAPTIEGVMSVNVAEFAAGLLVGFAPTPLSPLSNILAWELALKNGFETLDATLFRMQYSGLRVVYGPKRAPRIPINISPLNVSPFAEGLP
jgi:hypothetical protein